MNTFTVFLVIIHQLFISNNIMSSVGFVCYYMEQLIKLSLLIWLTMCAVQIVNRVIVGGLHALIALVLICQWFDEPCKGTVFINC